MSGLVITSAFSAIIKSFPNESVTKIQMLGTVPGLGTLVTTLFVGVLATRFSKKLLSLIGIFLIGLGGLLPIAFHSNVNLLLAFGVLMGVGLGFTTPIYPMLISIFFDGDDRVEMMGQSTAFSSLGSIIMVVGGSTLGAVDWTHTYYIFAITILVFFIVLFTLPNDHVPVQPTSAAGPAQKKPNTLEVVKKLNKYVFVIVGITLIMSMVYTIFQTNLSIILASKALGGTSAAGIVNAIGTVGGLITGFSMKYIKRLFKDNILVAGFASLMLTFILIRFAGSLAMAMVGSFLSGFAMATIMSTLPYYVSLVTSGAELAIAMSLFQFMNSLGSFFSPMVLGAFHISSGNDAFFVGIIASAVMGLFCLFGRVGKHVTKQGVQEKAKRSVVKD
ncbi:hypothetical protein IV38_GL002042 [Lactobacillus selangorensis]|uniref:Major facilitator superfamily (MFS) profile domain-containing protein n=2 Tax=Lactobacillus selangorensis TaxID=81857 RepID=A0A0R2FG42_9LACO|nr:hypothetical protein IV38_GL002042 [Lactobacillus selangorensis]KRN30141.1 hypothetical protein IV40_GL001987 [Lactobacillus selangorensis]